MNPWIKEATDANQGAVGYATNGVAIFGPYNSGCCDATFNEIQTMDYWKGIRNKISSASVLTVSLVILVVQ